MLERNETQVSNWDVPDRVCVDLRLLPANSIISAMIPAANSDVSVSVSKTCACARVPLVYAPLPRPWNPPPDNPS